MNSTHAADDLPYLAALIWQLEWQKDTIPSNQLVYTQGLILIASGLVPGHKIHVSEIPTFQDALDDFVENFKALYPQYFNNIHPAFLWVVGIVAEEEMSYNQR